MFALVELPKVRELEKQLESRAANARKPHKKTRSMTRSARLGPLINNKSNKACFMSLETQTRPPPLPLHLFLSLVELLAMLR